MKNIMCPKCKTINPPEEFNYSEFHDTERCRQVISTKYLFGFIPIKTYCNSVNYYSNDFSSSGNVRDSWIYFKVIE